MKNLFLSLMMCLLAMCPLQVGCHCAGTNGKVAATADNEYMKQLKMVIANINAQCPMKSDYMTTIKSVKVKGRTVVYEFVVDDDLLLGQDAREVFGPEGQERLRRSILSKVLKSDGVLDYVALVGAAECTIRYQYKCKKSGYSFRLEFEPQDYFDYYDSAEDGELEPYVDDRTYTLESLQSEAEQFKQHLPVTISTGLTLVDVRLTDKYMVYCIDLDEDVLGGSLEELDGKEFRDSMIQGMVKGQNEVQKAMMIKMMKDTGLHYQYQYKGSPSQHVVTVEISPEDL